MPTHGQTGLVIPVPEADALLAAVGARYPGTVREGVPAHVSLLYPFVAAAELDEQVTSALCELLAEQAPMPVQFAECYRREGFVALRPDPIDGLTELMNKTHLRWPDVVPYEGVYQDVEPHRPRAPIADPRPKVGSSGLVVGCRHDRRDLSHGGAGAAGVDSGGADRVVDVAG